MTDMGPEQNKALIRRFYADIQNAGRLEAAEAYFTDDWIDHSLPPGATIRVADVRRTFTRVRTGFPDLRYEIEELIAEGDLVVSRYRMEGTHSREYYGLQPTGKRVQGSGIEIYRIQDGRIAETWHETGTKSLYELLTGQPLSDRQRREASEMPGVG
jgi:steroid delta-isomerase-like uncharacterized protein